MVTQVLELGGFFTANGRFSLSFPFLFSFFFFFIGGGGGGGGGGRGTYIMHLSKPKRTPGICGVFDCSASRRIFRGVVEVNVMGGQSDGASYSKHPCVRT